jgi:hypothetical protein
MTRPSGIKKETNGSALSFEAKLWAAADALHNNMDIPVTPASAG